MRQQKKGSRYAIAEGGHFADQGIQEGIRRTYENDILLYSRFSPIYRLVE